MNYTGKLYGKVGRQYIPLRLTSEDVDKLEAALREIAKQKILDEVEDPVCCDYEEGYTACVEIARAAISPTNSKHSLPELGE